MGALRQLRDLHRRGAGGAEEGGQTRQGRAKPAHRRAQQEAGDAAARRMAQGGRQEATRDGTEAKPHGPPAADHLAEIKDDLKNDPEANPAFVEAVVKVLEEATEDELTVIDMLLDLPGEKAHVADFFCGAHTIIRDGGKLYEQLKKLPTAQSRGTEGKGSSHASKGEQFNIPTHAGAILFGVTADGSGTFFQLEGHDMSSLGEILLHGLDFVKYKLTGRNQSKFGSSENTDSNPIVLTP